ncbi:MAG: dihydropteroate synthase [bacterium]
MTHTDIQIMGIVNVTPDSFSDGGQFNTEKKAVEHGIKLAKEGAHILDIGGESTRPGAQTVPVAEEMARVIPVIRKLANNTAALISVDTRKPEIARAAKAAGAHIWNDVSALTYAEDSLTTAVELNMKTVLMHAQGTPQNMQDHPYYKDVVLEVADYLNQRLSAALRAGLTPDRLILDPGIGFGKTIAHNVALIRHIEVFTALGCPVLLGASRKRFIGDLDRPGSAQSRLGGSVAVALEGVKRGVQYIRVHDVAATRQALALYFALNTN